jgi:hypothetical protein
MGVAFIAQIIERSSILMNTMIADEVIQKEWVLKATDRCDQCAAEALVKVTGLSGELLFCGHHYNKIMDDSKGYKKMMSFMITVFDERDKLS